MKQQECSLQNIGYTYFCLGYKLARTFCQAPLVCFLFPTEKIGLQSFWRELPNSLFVLRPITDFIFIGWFDVSQRCGSHSVINKIIVIWPYALIFWLFEFITNIRGFYSLFSWRLAVFFIFYLLDDLTNGNCIWIGLASRRWVDVVIEFVGQVLRKRKMLAQKRSCVRQKKCKVLA